MVLSFARYLRYRKSFSSSHSSEMVAIIGVQTVIFAFGIMQGHTRLTMRATNRISFVLSHHGSSQVQKLGAEDLEKKDCNGKAKVSSCIIILQIAFGSCHQ
jgi:ABC-type lipoprotein release transport system permease subunit